MGHVKEGKILKTARLQTKVNDWLEIQAEDHGTTISVEINAAVREKMAREAAKERQLASVGAA